MNTSVIDELIHKHERKMKELAAAMRFEEQAIKELELVKQSMKQQKTPKVQQKPKMYTSVQRDRMKELLDIELDHYMGREFIKNPNDKHDTRRVKIKTARLNELLNTELDELAT
jgi:hypothetical protein